MMEFIIKQQELEAVVNYLATKPWAESHQMIQMLANLKKCEASAGGLSAAPKADSKESKEAPAAPKKAKTKKSA